MPGSRRSMVSAVVRKVFFSEEKATAQVGSAGKLGGAKPCGGRRSAPPGVPASPQTPRPQYRLCHRGAYQICAGGSGGTGLGPPRTCFLVAADEHRVQDFGRSHQDKASRRANPERGVHLSSPKARQKTPGQHGYLGSYRKRSKRLLQMKVSVPQAASATAPGKVFWFFSSEKNAFLSPPATRHYPGAHPSVRSRFRGEAPCQ